MGNYDITLAATILDLWDFGDKDDVLSEQGKSRGRGHNSYSYQLPLPLEVGETVFPICATTSPSAAVIADRNPYWDLVNIQNNTAGLYEWDENDREILTSSIPKGNSVVHQREGQNVTYGDGHSSYEKYSDVGVKHDNIYTYQPFGRKAAEKDIRIGINPTARDENNKPANDKDSFLVF